MKNGGRFGKQVGHQTPQADQGKETHEKHGAGGPACATAGLGPESKTHDGIIFGVWFTTFKGGAKGTRPKYTRSTKLFKYQFDFQDRKILVK